MEAELRLDDDESVIHAPEPWTQDGRYVRDAIGRIVVRGRSPADARRIVVAVNATRGIPSDALGSWMVQDVSDPETRPELEVALPPEPVSRTRVAPPATPDEASGSSVAFPVILERRVFPSRVTERRLRERRRGADPVAEIRARQSG